MTMNNQSTKQSLRFQGLRRTRECPTREGEACSARFALPPSLLTLTKTLALATLCGLLLTSGTLAQEGRPEQRPTPEQPTPEASTKQKPPDPNETLTPSPQASQVVDGDLIFTSPGAFTYTRDIRLSDNFGGLRFFGADSLTTTPAGAAIQFFGNNASPFNGLLYLDSGALDSAAIIFRTAETSGTITERMRITAEGNIGIGTTSPDSKLQVVGSGTGVSGSGNNFGVFGNSPRIPACSATEITLACLAWATALVYLVGPMAALTPSEFLASAGAALV